MAERGAQCESGGARQRIPRWPHLQGSSVPVEGSSATQEDGNDEKMCAGPALWGSNDLKLLLMKFFRGVPFRLLVNLVPVVLT